MGWISTIFVHKALDAAQYLKCIDPAARITLLRQLGVDPSAPVDPKAMISDAAFFGLLERFDELDDRGRSVPIHMGTTMRCDDYGAFGLAFKSAPNLLGSYARIERYGRIVTSIANFRIDQSGGAVFMEVMPGREHRRGLTMTNELALAAATSLSREVSDNGSFTPAAVHLMADRPSDDRAYRDHFRCSIQYGANRDAIELTMKTAQRQNRLSDEGMSKFFETHLEGELSALRKEPTLGEQTKDAIARALSEGPPRMEDIARGLGFSARSFHRRLADHGLTFQMLAEETRRELAEGLLRDERYSLADIAFLTGFSEQSSFTRAFKRWVGHTPTGYRKAQFGL